MKVKLAFILIFIMIMNVYILASAQNSIKEEAKKMVTDYIDQFQSYHFGKVVSIGDKTKYLNAIDNIDVVYDPKIEANAEYSPEVRSDGINVTWSKAKISIKEDISTGTGSATIAGTLWHEATHAIEDNNADTDKEGKSGNRDYDERNIEYMEMVVRALENLRLLEKGAEKGESNEKLKERYEEFLSIFNEAENAPGPKAYPIELAELKGWMGFYVKPEKIMEHYASGLAGDKLKSFAEQYNSSVWGKYSWEGKWDSNWGGMVLTQRGGAVTGTYTWDKGRITGTVIGNKLTGTWSETPSYAPDKDAGAIEFTMSEDGNSFTGKWCYGASGSWSDWQGTKRITKVLPAPAANESTPKNNIILQISNPNMSANGSLTKLDSSPMILESRTVLPIRAVVEKMGGTVDWDSNNRKVSIKASGTNIDMWLDKKTISINGKNKTIDVAPTTINGRTMVPVRFVADNIPGCLIQWNDETKSAIISY